MATRTEAERIAQLEILVDLLRKEQQEMSSKIDELLALRNKGAGVFWLITVLAGTGIFGIASTLFQWFKGIT